ncbi:hypothetical protein EK21DRAFT_86669 [Setomelanomma holmii]|uniref:Uncharacterized protein n=1 Tax=Setomelanomma holmii TaxID=210430 RepID=A0A9P4HEA0_9PLEO|nr:hypothetical protein EK21DRAFT_86669 [Setomelanomma holmii]
MSSLLQRLGGGGGADLSQALRTNPRDTPQKRRRPVSAPPKDVNVPKKRFQIHQRCLYERMLPGNAYVSAHVNRLQHGYYHSGAVHDDLIDDVYFVSVHFVFHPQDPNSHRFKSARIEVCVHGDGDASASFRDRWDNSPVSQPRILKHAPELMFGAVSPENLQWNFSLSSSLGVSQAPVSATLNPTGGMNGSYKVYHMMSIQGSIRSRRSPMGPEYDVEDGMAVWTLEENLLQRSGLPREFDFVLLVHKPDDVKNVFLTVDVDAEVEAWYGSYPQWYTNFSRYMPTQDFRLDFNADIGQRFLPSQPGRGFNFASLPHALDEYVLMPGTVYPTNNTKSEDDKSEDPKPAGNGAIDHSKAIEASSPVQQPQQPATPTFGGARSLRRPQGAGSGGQRHSWAPEDLNVRVVLEHQYPRQVVGPRRYSMSPLSGQEPSRYPSVRRRKSRTGLKEYGAKQALQEMANEALHGQGATVNVNRRSDDHIPGG